ncbi:MAG: MBOAT family protein, partial [Carboxylicivirga sp.]|nr:MBOAT family protein [Carboxylicivirga sp.]
MKELLNHISGQSDLFLFSHVAFWYFFGAILLFNLILQKKRSLRISFLFMASLYFYYKTGGYFFCLLIFSTLTDYSIGLALQKFSRQWVRRLFLTLSLIVNLSVLAYFKYTYFIVDILEGLYGTEIETYDYLAAAFNHLSGSNFSIESITLPIGISFFTFQTISYTVDVYRRQLKPVRNIIDFGF